VSRFVLPHRPLPESERPPRLRLISDYPNHYAQRAPSREAVVFDAARWTYPELARQIDACAKALLAFGVERGDRVATMAPPHPDYLVTFLASASIGAIWVGLNPRYQLRELAYVLHDAQPGLVFTRTQIRDRHYRSELAELMLEAESVGRWVVLNGDPPVPGADPYEQFLAAGESVSDTALADRRAQVASTDPAVIVYTSGTTGKPKGALITHHGLIHVARVQTAIWPIEPLRGINNLPINHIGCIGDISCHFLVAGGTMIMQDQFDPGTMLDAVARERLTIFGHVPTVLQLLTTHPRWPVTDFSTVQLIIWEGAAAPRDLITILRGACPNLANAYGMTETVGSVTFTFDATDLDVLADSVGWPVPEYEVRIADGEGGGAAPGTPGEIQVRGDFVTAGYWGRPDATRELFTEDGWLHTGDLAVERPDGAYRLIGRLKEMFKSGGYNVYPREIEQILESHPAVAMAAVIGVPDTLYQEVGHAFVIQQPGATLTAVELVTHCRTQLANYKVPKHFTIAADLPMLPIGKIDKQALKRQASGTSPD
jgi:acyl-CoA synthetase (AMP-forming)/AMP-acid ligase II